MDVMVLWMLLRRWWYLLAIPVGLSLILALPEMGSALFPPETYGASIRFTAAAPPDAEHTAAAQNDALPRSGTYEDTAYVPWLASEYVVVNLQQWVISSGFAREVSIELARQGIDIEAEEVQRGLAADSARSILVVYFGWDDEAELEAIARATITVLQEQNQTYFPQFATAPAQIVPLDEIEIVRTVPPVTARLELLVRIALGGVIGLMLVAGAAYWDDRIYTPVDLTQMEMEILAVIPRD